MQKLLLVYYSENRATSRILKVLPNIKYGFSSDLGGNNGGVLSMRIQVILDSLFPRPGLAPTQGTGRKESSGTGLGTFMKLQP